MARNSFKKIGGDENQNSLGGGMVAPKGSRTIKPLDVRKVSLTETYSHVYLMQIRMQFYYVICPEMMHCLDIH